MFFSNCVDKACECKATPCSNKCDDCFTAGDAIVTPLNGVGPCGQTGYVNLAVLNEKRKCGTTKEFQVIRPVTTDAFSRVWIENDKLYYTTAGLKLSEPGCFYQINYKMSCKESGLASIGCITIGIRDMCDCVFCETGKCDPCTGECEKQESDLGVTVQAASGDLSVNIERA